MEGPYRLAVVGVGGIGAAACYWAAKRVHGGLVGFEQFELFHHRGASQDHSRIIRLTQHQEPYATLAPHSYRAWSEVESEAGHQIVFRTGGLIIEDTAARAGLDTGSRNIDGYTTLLDQHGVDYELLDAAATSARWPQLRLNNSESVLYQRESGIVDAARANAIHLALARSHGAEIRPKCRVIALRPGRRGIEIVTDDRSVLAQHVVLCCGAWTNNLLAGIHQPLPLRVTQEQVTYYATPHLAEFSESRFPVFMWHGRHNFYGVPVHGEMATKLGQHLGGHPVTAESRDFNPDPEREERQEEFLSKHLPHFLGPKLYTKTCLYTMPPDQHFVVDSLPAEPRISVFIGAGHAFKFASLLGRILVDVALDGAARHTIDAFALRRRALTDRSFAPSYHV